MRRFLRRFAGCERGIAALEFSLVAPFLIILLLGGFEVSRFIIAQQKIEKVAFSLADIASQYDPDDGVDIDQVFSAIEHILKPYSLGSEGRIFLSSISRDDTTDEEMPPTVNWQCSSGQLNEASRVGEVAEQAELPQDFLIDDRDNVVVAEVFLRFSPVLMTSLTEPFVVYRTAMFRPRLGSLTATPTSGESACAR